MKNNNEIVEIYTDGACSGNPGPGGWAAVLIYKGIKKEISGFEENTTNNRMELKAAIEGLKALKRPCKVNLYSDSSYLINAFNEGWIEKWQKNNWLKSDKTPVENQDLWKELLEVSKPHQINWIKVKGHSDNEYNNLCDRLATEQIKKHIKENP
ncbi:MAG: Ribonuclease H [Caldanaerobacter subterraneus]|jgi:ribonuclease HI|uniref:Ribonuclease H n=4 Tax=Caldanaerobacter subterraneus TaxID=911092 RepID=RNH_CALS4|nr:MULTISPECIES: ribonuclease HI [Caldanaerobacter]Q8RA67.1 RecName: Full=Ribonuclease H; Short=RNase H [Caldanaerobacter subterraneus subsp. tengcongensis MB4]AAM24584.1 Ribonuclease HI [Caldanaerobacter subterraneus subsp. tengcongensis MB4]ERM91165.1 ribonuclease H [Caldanaerobacter subterraneus subsp. yonseiensis KB-1]KUK09656.1 MAG: Ribonuclease H [Caldanaerobacter subterraneus]MCS3915853.1 ribonuclease HI [Caldanaerobacter subterraneus subsp. tengcongensis MB4]MDI3518957.1 ribonuclease 